MKIYNLGSLNIDYVYNVDHFVRAGETLSSDNMSVFPGGKGLNQSVALSKAGAQVLHGAVIGENGGLLLDALKDAGVDTARIQKSKEGCGHAIIQVDKNGQNCILLFAGANHRLTRQYIDTFLQDAQKDDILLLQNETNGLEIAFEVAHQKQMQIAFNPSPYHEDLKKLPLSYVSWWFCNEIEGAALFGSESPEKIATNFLQLYSKSNLILTLGKAGSMFINAEGCIKQPIYPVKAVDTTAAGDTFTGYFLAALTRGLHAASAMELAAKASSVTVSRLGASSSIPYLKEIK
ncbi:MAG: ribokinase [Clostridia bacterium]|nr:ribokinase [Clostridia bacterium]